MEYRWFLNTLFIDFGFEWFGGQRQPAKIPVISNIFGFIKNWDFDNALGTDVKMSKNVKQPRCLSFWYDVEIRSIANLEDSRL